MCVDFCLIISFSFTRDSSKGFLLRHIKAHREVCPTSTYCVKVDDLLTGNNRESRVVGKGRGAPEVNNLVYTKRQKHIYAISTHETTLLFIFSHQMANTRGILISNTKIQDLVNVFCPVIKG